MALRTLCAGLAGIALLQILPAAANEPLYAKNLSPVAGLLGLPSQRNAYLAARGSFDLALPGRIASPYVSDSSGP